VSATPSIPGDLRAAVEAHADRLGSFGRRLVHVSSIGSTNDEASRLANDGAPEGTIVIADAQTAGRGRMGHTWFSPPGAGLYVSIVLRPGPGSVLAAPDAAGLLTLLAGVAVADGVRAASGLDAAIKWPNDIVVVPASPLGAARPEFTAEGRAPAAGGPGWRKIAGILAEGFLTSGLLLHVVVGVGVNLARADYPPDLAGRASSIEEETGEPVERSRVLVELLVAFAREHTAIAAGDVEGVLARWRARSPSSTGAPIAWTAADGLRTGVTAGTDESGALLARTPTGTEIIRAGTVTWL
jgi:BirA family transcriptional regulator, biotin operon repressor / biotin---[acetyl-CoA-carboxylase] ligase